MSLTSACDLRYTFCHQEGAIARGRAMTTKEIATLCETAAGVGVRYLKPCLMRADNHVDVMGPLRDGARADDLAKLFREAASRRAPYWVEPARLPVASLPQFDRRVVSAEVVEHA